MTIFLPLLLAIIFLAVWVCVFTEGMWGNAIRLINVTTAGLLATNFFEPVADWMEGMMPSYTYMCDFIALWGLFAVLIIVFRLATDNLSKVKVRFLKLADKIGSGVLAAWVGWVVVSFALMSLHTAPLAKNFMAEGFQSGESMFFGFAPDQQWLSFMRRVSLGSFARSDTVPGKNERRAFNTNHDFIRNYEIRRTNLESHVTANDTVRVK